MAFEVIISDVENLHNSINHAMARIEDVGQINIVSVTQTQENGIVTLVIFFKWIEE